MKINPNDPWHPNPYKHMDACPHSIMGGCPACLGVTVRLKLAAMAMQGWLTTFSSENPNVASRCDAPSLANWAFELTDVMIERANRDEEETNEG